MYFNANESFLIKVDHDRREAVTGTKGYGGKFGVQTDRQDKSAAGWDHHEQVT